MKLRRKLPAGMLFFASSLLLAVSSDAEAAGRTKAAGKMKGGPITVVSHVDILPDSYRPGAEESAARLFRAESAASHRDQEVVSFGVFQETGVPNHFTLVETWRDAKAYARHVGSLHAVQFRQKIQPLLGSPFDARTLQQLR